MTINGIFSDQAFGPEILDDMSQAYQSVCEALGLKMIDDQVTRTVAETIIELAQRGVRNVEAMRTMALQEFNANYGLEQSVEPQETGQDSHSIAGSDRLRAAP